MTSSYKEKFWFWSSVEFIKRFLMVMFIVVLPLNTVWTHNTCSVLIVYYNDNNYKVRTFLSLYRVHSIVSSLIKLGSLNLFLCCIFDYSLSLSLSLSLSASPHGCLNNNSCSTGYHKTLQIPNWKYYRSCLWYNGDLTTT